jgi:hypothetical protein
MRQGWDSIWLSDLIEARYGAGTEIGSFGGLEEGRQEGRIGNHYHGKGYVFQSRNRHYGKIVGEVSFVKRKRVSCRGSEQPW